jgi:hypothetical protein
MLRNLSQQGVGFTHEKAFEPGQRFDLMLKSASSEAVGLIPYVVQWCRPTAADSFLVGAVRVEEKPEGNGSGDIQTD